MTAHDYHEIRRSSPKLVEALRLDLSRLLFPRDAGRGIGFNEALESSGIAKSPGEHQRTVLINHW